MGPVWKELLTTPTGVLAVWGAILGTVTLVWNIRRDVLQKADVRVMVDVAMIGVSGRGIVADKLLRYSIVNRGQRTVTIVNVGGRIGAHPTNARHFVLIHDQRFSDQLPKALGHSETASVIVNELSVLSDNLADMWATDSTGKRWRVTKKNLQALRLSPEWGKHVRT